MIIQRSLQAPRGVIEAAAPLRDGRSGPVRGSGLLAATRKNSVAIWLCMIGLIIPAAEAVVYIAGAKFSVGKLSIALLLVPALIVLCERGRKLVLSDVFVCATGGWIVMAALQAGGPIQYRRRSARRWSLSAAIWSRVPSSLDRRHCGNS